jgi:hypothetical protein
MLPVAETKKAGRGSSPRCHAPGAAAVVAVPSTSKTPNRSAAPEGFVASQEAAALLHANIEAAAAADAQITQGGPAPYQQQYHARAGASIVVPVGDPSSRDEEPLGYIDAPTSYDVICGAGDAGKKHEGNRRFVKIVQTNKEHYRRMPEETKKVLSHMVVHLVHNGGQIESTDTAFWKIPSNQQKLLQSRWHAGRFIKKSTINDLWYEVDNTGACREVSEAFREGSDDCWAASDDSDGADSADDDAGMLTSSEKEGERASKGETNRKKQTEPVQDCDLSSPEEMNRLAPPEVDWMQSPIGLVIVEPPPPEAAGVIGLVIEVPPPCDQDSPSELTMAPHFASRAASATESESGVSQPEDNKRSIDDGGRGDGAKRVLCSTEASIPFANAKVYLLQVRRTFWNQSGKYNEFVSLVKQLRESDSVGSPALLAKVLILLRGHEGLIAGFEAFLPYDYRANLSRLLAQQKLNDAAFDLANLM